MNNLISEVIFDDAYRTFVLNIISILLIYFGLNYPKEKYHILYLAFFFILILPFFLITLTGIAFTNFDTQIIKELLIWSFRWIAYFIVMFILQHIIIIHTKKLGKTLKILLCILLLIISLNISLRIVLPYNNTL